MYPTKGYVTRDIIVGMWKIKKWKIDKYIIMDIFLESSDGTLHIKSNYRCH
jgi:hypothetical protein